MDDFGDSRSNTAQRSLRKRRSNLFRRPLNESESPQGYLDSVSLSSTPSEHMSDAPSVGRESSTPSLHLPDAETVNESTGLKSGVEDRLKSRQMKDSKTSEQATGGHHNEPLGAASDGIGTVNKFNKVKLKVGGLTHTIHTRSSSGGSSVAGTFSAKSSSDAIGPPTKLNRQENYDVREEDEKVGLRGVPWKDFSKTSFGFGKVDSFGVDIPEESVKPSLKHGQSSKNKSTIKKYLPDELYDDDDDDDDEIRYLQKLKTSRISSYDNTEYEDGTRHKKLRKISRVMDRDIGDSSLGVGDYGSSRSGKESKKLRPARASEDTDYTEEESVSDGEVEHKNKKQWKASIDVAEYSKESTITTRRRATLTGRENSPGLSARSVQFPDGLPLNPPRNQKEQLPDVEQQLKRAEAAQRRRIQNEKAARESEAEAIRKILGQDSSRKRREEKNKKRQEELAQKCATNSGTEGVGCREQFVFRERFFNAHPYPYIMMKERNAKAAKLAPDAVRWFMGPSGTVVTFPNEIGLPSIFEPKSCSYPPPRETCAGPSCTNVYKYRDSKSKLPLCSLQCYKALH